MKDKWHVLGIDDSPFTRSENKTILVGVLMSHDFHVDAVVTETITIDGNDAEAAITKIVQSETGMSANAIITNGITFGGFNMIEPSSIYDSTGIPVISVTRKEPDIQSMKSAISKHGNDLNKMQLLDRLEPEELRLKSGSILFINRAGIEYKEASELVSRSIFRGNMPEAVRIAHIIGTVLKKGKTLGRV